MLYRFKIPALFLALALTISCSNKPGIKQQSVSKKISPDTVKAALPKKTADSTSITALNIVTNDLVSFISGMPGKKNGCLSKIDTMAKWKAYSRDLDKMFSNANSFRISKMESWADSQLIKDQNIKTVFYPFSGPDFLNAHTFYPNADQYIMIGMEPIGFLPDICNMRSDSVKSYLNKVDNSLKDIFKRSYFITSRMSKDLRKTKVNGTIPLISLFIRRTGHQIISIERVGIDSLGKCTVIDNTNNDKNIVQGIKVDFRPETGKKIQSAYYFRTDISDEGLKKTKGFITYLSGLPPSFTYLKAASYLMHYDTFKMIRSVIFNVSSTILQDDSGIAYKYFDKVKWDIRLYGKYSNPISEFKYIKEPDLEEAYKKSVQRPLSYTLGYNWGTDHTNILYAVKNNMISKK